VGIAGTLTDIIPPIVEDLDATALVPPSRRVRRDEAGNLVIETSMLQGEP
jgi:hypothetical protein